MSIESTWYEDNIDNSILETKKNWLLNNEIEKISVNKEEINEKISAFEKSELDIEELKSEIISSLKVSNPNFEKDLDTLVSLDNWEHSFYKDNSEVASNGFFIESLINTVVKTLGDDDSKYENSNWGASVWIDLKKLFKDKDKDWQKENKVNDKNNEKVDK